MNKSIVGRAARHVIYVPSKFSQDDLHLVKEYRYFDDGSEDVVLTPLINRKRPFWITKEAKRTHTEKMEYAPLGDLKEFNCTQRDLVWSIGKALNIPVSKHTRLSDINNNPYVYGSDISASCLIRKAFATKYPNHLLKSASVGAFDVETDEALTKDKSILLAGFTFKNRAIVGINERFYDYHPKEVVLSRVDAAIKRYLGPDIKKRNMTIEYAYGPEIDILEAVIAKMHEWGPDFISIWNMNFDIKKVIDCFKRHERNIARAMSDPSVPEEYQHFYYREGRDVKRMESGREMPLKDIDRWHYVVNPAKFYFIDSMCLYKRIRTGKEQETSYSLNSILGKEIQRQKLDFKEVEEKEGLDWHIEMQKNYRDEYVAYNLFDCISLELLDEKTLDIGVTYPALCRFSDYHTYESNPRKLADDLHFWHLENGCVVGSTGNKMRTDIDDMLLGGQNWISTLAAYQMADNGLVLFNGGVPYRSMVYIGAFDVDIEGTYPKIGDICNISKQTTYMEMCNIEGWRLEDIQRFGINLTGGVSNVIETLHQGFNYPTLDTMMDYALSDPSFLDVV